MLENDIIQGCKKQDRKAQKAFVDEYSRYLFGVCRRYINIETQAKDCLQESLLHILTNIKTYEEQGKFKAWIARITVYKCLQSIRKEKKHISFLIDELHEPVSDTSASYILETQDVMRFLNDLAPNYRIALNMYLIEGYSHKEIAEQLNIKEGSSRALVSRGRKMIAQKFEEDRLRVVHTQKKDLVNSKLSLGFK